MDQESVMSSANVPQKPKISLAPVRALSNPPADEAIKSVTPTTAAIPDAKTGSPRLEAVAAKPAVAKPVLAKPVPAAPAAARVEAKSVVAKTPAPVASPETKAAAKPAAPAPVAAKPAAINPAPIMPAALKAQPAPVAPKAVAKPVTVAVAASAPVFASMGEAILRSQVQAARHLGTLQNMALDHAVTGLKAGLGEAEELTRSATFSDALIVQARAFRRGQDAMMAFFTDMAKVARP
jgi:hypothetical protein